MPGANGKERKEKLARPTTFVSGWPQLVHHTCIAFGPAGSGKGGTNLITTTTCNHISQHYTVGFNWA